MEDAFEINIADPHKIMVDAGCRNSLSLCRAISNWSMRCKAADGKAAAADGKDNSTIQISCEWPDCSSHLVEVQVSAEKFISAFS